MPASPRQDEAVLEASELLQEGLALLAEREREVEQVLRRAEQQAQAITARAEHTAAEIVRAAQDEAAGTRELTHHEVEEMKRAAEEELSRSKRAAEEELSESKRAAQDELAEAKRGAEEEVARLKRQAEEEAAERLRLAEEEAAAIMQDAQDRRRDLANAVANLRQEVTTIRSQVRARQAASSAMEPLELEPPQAAPLVADAPEHHESPPPSNDEPPEGPVSDVADDETMDRKAPPERVPLRPADSTSDENSPSPVEPPPEKGKRSKGNASASATTAEARQRNGADPVWGRRPTRQAVPAATARPRWLPRWIPFIVLMVPPAALLLWNIGSDYEATVSPASLAGAPVEAATVPTRVPTRIAAEAIIASNPSNPAADAPLAAISVRGDQVPFVPPQGTVTPANPEGPVVAVYTTYITYTVQPGDTLNKVATDFGVSREGIVNATGLIDPNLLVVGQVLTIPRESGWLYRVQADESLEQIATRFGANIDEVLASSMLASRSVRPGDLVFVPNRPLPVQR